MARDVTCCFDRAVNAALLWAIVAVHSLRMPRFQEALAIFCRAVESLGGPPVR